MFGIHTEGRESAAARVLRKGSSTVSAVRLDTERAASLCPVLVFNRAAWPLDVPDLSVCFRDEQVAVSRTA